VRKNLPTWNYAKNRDARKTAATSLHDNTASLQLPQHTRQKLLRKFLQLVVLVVLLVATLLLTPLVLLSTWVATLAALMLILTALVLVLISVGSAMALSSVRVRGDSRSSTGQVDVYNTSILLSSILKAEFLTDLFNSRLDLLNVARGMDAFAHNTTRFISSENTTMSNEAYT